MLTHLIYLTVVFIDALVAIHLLLSIHFFLWSHNYDHINFSENDFRNK